MLSFLSGCKRQDLVLCGDSSFSAAVNLRVVRHSAATNAGRGVAASISIEKSRAPGQPPLVSEPDVGKARLLHQGHGRISYAVVPVQRAEVGLSAIKSAFS